MRNKTHTDIQTYSIKQKSGIWRAAHPWWETLSSYLSQSVYFIGQYKEKTRVKIKL
jgi:hypothetical protein